jgi:hypothetical protein
MSQLYSLGVGGVLLVLVIRELFRFLREREANNRSVNFKSDASDRETLMLVSRMQGTVNSLAESLERLAERVLYLERQR